MANKIIYPDSGIQKVFFDGGLNNKFEKSIIKDNESPSCLNVVFENGAVATRGGTSILNTTPVGSFSFDGLYTRMDKSGSETMIAWANGTAYALTGASTFTAIASSVSIFTSGVRVGATQTENYIFFGNGGSTPYKWNGSEFTRHGVPVPSAPTISSYATGVLTGDYQYKVTYVNSGAVQGDVSTASATMTAVSATIRVTIPTAPASFGVNARRIYRTEAGGTDFKFVTVVSDNSTTTYDDNTADVSLGASAPTDQGLPPNYQVVVFHPAVQRMFFLDPANENYAWYSEAANPYVVKATNFDRFGDKSTDVLQTLVVMDNYLVVGGQNKLHIWYFPDNSPANWLKIECKSPYGCKSPFGIVPYDNGVLMPVTQNSKFVGYAKLIGESVSPSSTLLTISTVGSDVLSEMIEPYIFNTQEAYLKNISAISYKNKIYIAFTYGAGNTDNNRVLVFDYSYSRLGKGGAFSWVPWDGMTPEQFTIYNGLLYYATSSSTGYIYQMNTAFYRDNASAINSYYYTKDFYGYAKSANMHKDFRNLNILVDKAGDYYMNVSAKIDSDIDDGTNNQIDLNPGGSLWNAFRWGNDLWGGGREQDDIRVDLGQLAGKRIQFKFSNQNTINQRFKVHYMSFEYNAKGTR